MPAPANTGGPLHARRLCERLRLSTKPQTSFSTGNRTWPGHLVVACIVIAVALLLYFRGNGPDPAPARTVALADISGFRADAWLLPNDELLGFVEVPAGPFIMGSDKTTDPMAFDNERWSSSQTRGSLDLATFYINRYEVTVAQFQAFIDATKQKTDSQALGSPPTHPVTFVSWPDAL